ncbi:hypothetical protein [Ferrimonas kyonanensis]|uniref:hypothetical protein n=1 Tax=Ferrimonas kyonanensis TaxID=364763 RepID=UPI00048A1698|nr:hypothetical protein [Ferrimonas kyonanensis]
MSDLDKILLTTVLTIFGGLMIHVLSQMFIKMFLEPCIEYKKIRSDVISHMSFYSNMFDSKLRADDSDDYRERYYKAQDDIRLSMAKYRASYNSITPLILARLLRIVPSFSDFESISKNLLTLSFLGSIKHDESGYNEQYNLAKETLKLLQVKGY